MLPNTLNDIGQLTHREREVLWHIGKGRVTKEIAFDLDISTETVANHRKGICRKLAIHSTATLASYGAQHLEVLDDSYCPLKM